MIFNRTQALFLALFVILNSVIFSFGDEQWRDGVSYHPTYWNASDGQRYWAVAVNLAKKGEFTISTKWIPELNAAGQISLRNDVPLRRGGPLPALLFAGPIKLFGLNTAAPFIVGFQCTLLFFAGLFSRELCAPYGASRNVMQGLVIFNPNLISLAHHAQSDLIFMVLATALFVLVSQILGSLGEKNTKQYIFLGIIVGLLPLARPMGLVYIGLMPAIILFVILSAWLWKQVNWQRFLSGSLIVVLITSTILVPWGLRNKAVFGEFGLTQSRGIMMQWHYNELRRYSGSGFVDAVEETQYLEKYGVTDRCLENLSCRGEQFRAYLNAIVESPKDDLIRALTISYAKLFFAGGVSQLSRYLGIETSREHNFLRAGSGLLNEFRQLFDRLAGKYRGFAVLFLFGIIFTSFCRGFGVLGIIFSIRKYSTLRYNLFYIMTLFIFLGMYLFSSIARFRAPLEPILMLYAAIGISLFRRNNAPKEHNDNAEEILNVYEKKGTDK